MFFISSLSIYPRTTAFACALSVNPAHNGFRLCAFDTAALRIGAGVGRERIVPDDAKDAKISGLVNYSLIIARNGSARMSQSMFPYTAI